MLRKSDKIEIIEDDEIFNEEDELEVDHDSDSSYHITPVKRRKTKRQSNETKKTKITKRKKDSLSKKNNVNFVF